MHFLTAPVKNKILLIDDEEDLLQSLSEIITSFSYEVISAKDGIEGLEKLAQNIDDIGLILCDISMPKMNGIQFFKTAMAKYAFIPAVMLTAHSEVEYTTEAVRLGAIDYLVKPFDPSTLADKIELWMQIARRREGALMSEDNLKTYRMEALLRIQNTNLTKHK